MKKKKTINRFMLYFLCTTLTLVTLTSCNEYVIVEYDELTKDFEYAYFEGQRDALTNDIRIKMNQDSCWIWTKSPWNSGKQPIYDPSYKCK